MKSKISFWGRLAYYLKSTQWINMMTFSVLAFYTAIFIPARIQMISLSTLLVNLSIFFSGVSSLFLIELSKEEE